MYEHKYKLGEGFTKRYNIDMLVYYEVTDDINGALAREKQIKDWRRSKRVALIESTNPQWRDLSDGWFSPARQIPRSARNDSSQRRPHDALPRAADGGLGSCPASNM